MPQVLPSQVVQYIDKSFPTWAPCPDVPPVKLDFSHSGRVSAIVTLADRVPTQLLVLDAADYAEFIGALEILRSRLAVWKLQGNTTAWSGEPVRVVRNLLARCPDEYPSVSTHELAFVTDTDLRAELLRDLSAVETSLVNGGWKATTILAGSLIEALLLWKLGTLNPSDVASAETSALNRKPKPLVDWVLNDLIAVAAVCPSGSPILSPDAATQARLAKDYRNLIHPGRAVRLSQKCNRGTAYAAVAGVELVVHDLTL